MICPNCGCPESMVIDSRKHDMYTNRRRECIRCGIIFKTVEITEINEKNLIRIESIMKENSKPREFERIINLIYMRCFHYSQYRKMKGLKQDENGSSKDE